jgi:tartrate dehydratase beta subunit/fumarate hydratase class I family protein
MSGTGRLATGRRVPYRGGGQAVRPRDLVRPGATLQQTGQRGRQLPTAIERCASIIAACGSFPACAYVDVVSFGPTGAAVLNAEGAAGLMARSSHL